MRWVTTAMYKAIRSSGHSLRAVHHLRTIVVWRKRSSQSTGPPTISKSKVIDMEAQKEYRVGGFHPVELGDVLNARYCVLRKLGFGCYSTVWLAEDHQYFFSLKIQLIKDPESMWPSKFCRAMQPKEKKGQTNVIFVCAPHLQTQIILDINISSPCWTTSSRMGQMENICA